MLPEPANAQTQRTSQREPTFQRDSFRPLTNGDPAAIGAGVQPYKTFDTTQRSEIRPTGAEEGVPDAPPGGPLREAYQAPDIFRTPNPTPLEQVPPPEGPYAPRVMPGQNQLPPLPRLKPEPPMPPLAPLVNIHFAETWLPGSGDEVGWNDIDFRFTLAMGHSGVFVTPGYGVHFLNGPTRTDLPGTLYDTYIDIRWKKKIDEQWGFELAWTPSYYTDGNNTTSDAYRFITTALGFYQVSPEWQALAGVMYLDRFDINWFPVFGLIWADPEGESDWRHEIVFPRPKFARRVLRGDDKDGWVYLAGEFGGGAWAVQRARGQDDVVAYRDWRIMLGYESKVKDYSAISWLAEIGYVFKRQIEFDHTPGDFDPDSCGMARLTLSY